MPHFQGPSTAVKKPSRAKAFKKAVPSGFHPTTEQLGVDGYGQLARDCGAL
jgi:hypothetical protein